MPVDLSNRAPRDASRIDMNDNSEVRYWTDKFGVTAGELAAAVNRAGNMTEDVEAALGKRTAKMRRRQPIACNADADCLPSRRQREASIRSFLGQTNSIFF